MKKNISLIFLSFVVLFFACEKEQMNNPLPPGTAGMPDLVGDTIAITGWSDTLLSYYWTIRNIGLKGAWMDGPTNSEEDNLGGQVYQSEDTILNILSDIPAGGTIVGLSPLGFLEAGSTISNSFYMSYPNLDTSKYQYLILLVDYGNSVNESNEDNNTYYRKVN